jgi:PAS domain S-box-containing protein
LVLDDVIKKSKYLDVLLDDSIVSKSDKEGNITYINSNFTKVTGFTKEECLGKNHRILRHKDNSDQIFKNLWETITLGNVYKERLLNRAKDGSDFWASTTIIPYKDEDGNIVEYLCIREDITELLSHHRKKIKLQEDLKISKAKESFIVLFTHELKTPLNAIMNFSKYLLKKKESNQNVDVEKELSLLHQIYLSSDSMLSNINQLLEIAKIRSNKLKYHKTLFEAKKSIHKVAENHKDASLHYGVDIAFECGCKDVFIRSDIFRFEQILANIYSNAIKYCKKNVIVGCKINDNKIEISIEDDGYGVKDFDKIFELFEQDEDDLHTREKKGTGVGLYLVRLLCDDLGFDVRVEKSEKLGGLRFIVTKDMEN